MEKKWTDKDLEAAFDAGFDAVGSDDIAFDEFLQNLKDRKTQEQIHRNYPDLNATKEQMAEWQKLK